MSDPGLAAARARALRHAEELRAAAGRRLRWTGWARRHPWLTLAGAAAGGWAVSRLLSARTPAARVRRAAGTAARTAGSVLSHVLLRWGVVALEGYLRRRLAGPRPRSGALQREDPHATMPPSQGG